MARSLVEPVYEQQDSADDWELGADERVDVGTCDHCWKPALVKLSVDPNGQSLVKSLWCRACWDKRMGEI